MAYDPNGFQDYLRRNEGLLGAQLQQAQGLGGFGGLSGALGQCGQRQLRQPYRGSLDDWLTNPSKPKTIREELQLETDEWLKDTI